MDENTAQVPAEAAIVATPVEAPVVDVTQPAGVPHGTELEGTDGSEVVVYDLDDQGNVIGWHKEVK